MYSYTSPAEMYIEAQKETAADILKKVSIILMASICWKNCTKCVFKVEMK